jgi:hypothetical protein
MRPNERRGVFTYRKDETHQLDDVISTLIEDIRTVPTGEDAHTNAVQSLKVLMEARIADKAARKPLVSPDVLVAAMAHIFGIGMILGFEKANVVTSKSLSFVPKIKI